MVAMRMTPAFALIAALSSQIADAREIRRDAIPETFWGTWAPSAAACKDADKPPVVLTAKSYAGPAGSCDILYVTEIPGRDSAIYSARMSCSGPAPQAKTTANLIIRPDTAEQISLGASFESVATHHRCPAGAPAKQP
jgi:hypothetical protein